MRLLFSYLTGLVFSVGISLSGMINPAKVLNFFDLAGHWDPSLAFVMGGALAVTGLGYRVLFRRAGPVFAPAFNLPDTQLINPRLLGGAALFGVGWGIAGFCPGGALPALGTFNAQAWLFVAATLIGMWIVQRVNTRQ